MAEIAEFDNVATLTVLGIGHSGSLATGDAGELLFMPTIRDSLIVAGHSAELGIGDERGIRRVPVQVIAAGPPLVLKAIGETRADQRRAHVRVRHELPVRFEHEGETRTGRTVDCSGGGFQVLFDGDPLAVGDVAPVVLTLPDGHPIEAKAELVRETQTGSFSCRFVEIAESQRDRLIKEVFAVMRAQRAAAAV